MCQTKMKKQFLYIPAMFFLLMLGSCSKDADIIPDYLYGSWKIGGGDTVTFSRINGNNIITADIARGPQRQRSDYGFTYRNETIGIKDGPFGQGYVFYPSFRWIQTGQSFEILQIEWFPLSSSTNTWYTFTKIP